MTTTTEPMKVERFHSPGDRYQYDSNHCTSAKGWAQVDTGQDAWYFGTWANPSELKIVTYTEGDVAITTCSTPEQFADWLRDCKRWNEENGHGFKGIDCMCVDSIREGFAALGLLDLLHEGGES